MEEESVLDKRLKVNGLNIVGLNIRSVYPKKEQIEHLLENEKVGVLILSESWLSREIPNDTIRINDYKIYRLDRQRKARGGGICVYVHKKLKVNALIYSHLNVSNSNAEALVLNIQQKCTKSFNVVSTYRPPQGNQTRYTQIIEDILKDLDAQEDIFLIGDLNINYLDNTNATKNLKNLEKGYNMKQYITLPTRITRKSRTLIDHMYTNCKMVANSGVIEL